jgi:DNA repair protein RadC
LAELVGSIEPNSADQVATALLQTFGSLGGIFSATHGALAKAADSALLASCIQAARLAVLESLREDVRSAAFELRDQRILSYLVAKMKGALEEELHAIFLDRRRCYQTDEIIASGSLDQIIMRLRPLMRRAIELNAGAIVLFHNHPSGEASASEADLRFTDLAKAATGAIGVELYDHLIVAGPRVYSMRLGGIL